METILLGRSREKIPLIGMGTWKLGKDPKKEIEALKAGISAGMRFIDTAEMYGTEGLVGEAAKGEEVFIATKVSPNHFREKDVIKACGRSLKNLGTKTIDLYQLHWPNSAVPISETMHAMEELATKGIVRNIGVSNFSVQELEEAMGIMKKHEIASNQIEYSMLVRDAESGLLDFCRKEHITVIAYSPLAQGAIYSSKHKDLYAAIERIGKRHGKSPTQVALNWVISKGNIAAIPKASSKEHVLDNAGAAGWSLGAEDLAELSNFLGKVERSP